MTTNVVKKLTGVYQHSKTKVFYNVTGFARLVDNPSKILVLYEQPYDTTLRNTDIRISQGSLWAREINDFNAVVDDEGTKRFVKIGDLSLSKL